LSRQGIKYRLTDMTAYIAAGAASECDVIVAAGGDGTVSAVAAALVSTQKIFAVLPLGTVNSLAKDLGMPLDANLDFFATGHCASGDRCRRS
jgi:diacylglycerol kinase family enzyme